MKKKTLGEIATTVDAQLRGGDSSIIVEGVATLQNANANQISFLTNPQYRRFLNKTWACAVILSPRDALDSTVPALISNKPHVTYARVAALFAPPHPELQGVHPSAWVSPQAHLAEGTWIGPHTTVGDGAVIETGVFVGPHCVIGDNALLGAGTRLIAQVTICRDVHLGRRVLVHPGAVIGSDGFGLADDNGRWIKVPQLGSVRVGDDVEIGANTTIDRGALEDTVIEEGVKLDNQIQVAHNVYIGAHTAMAGCVGIAGSARIGRHCTLGGGVGVAGHLTISNNVHVTGMSLVAQSITKPGIYSSGLTVEPNRLWNRISARLRRLDELARRVTALEKKKSPHDNS